MRHMRLAILTTHIVQHFSSTAIFEIGIDIRQRYTVRIEETLEQEVILQRVQIGDLQTVGYYRSGCTTTTRAYRHVQFFAGSADEIHNDEEISRKTHLDDGVQFELNPLFQLLVVRQTLFAVPYFRPFHRQIAQVRRLERQAVRVVFFLTE